MAQAAALHLLNPQKGERADGQATAGDTISVYLQVVCVVHRIYLIVKQCEIRNEKRLFSFLYMNSTEDRAHANHWFSFNRTHTKSPFSFLFFP